MARTNNAQGSRTGSFFSLPKGVPSRRWDGRTSDLILLGGPGGIEEGPFFFRRSSHVKSDVRGVQDSTAACRRQTVGKLMGPESGRRTRKTGGGTNS